MKLDSQKIDKCVQNLSSPEPFSGVIYITEGDEILFAGEYGFAIKSESIPNKINTRFQIASGCKIFTSLAICQMVESDRLKFDALLREYVDATFPNYEPNITIHHLLTHTSGITSYFEEDINSDYEALWKELPMYRFRKPADFLPLFQYKSMKFPPGEKFDYNDAGYILLGLVIERATGIGFDSYIREKIFEAAGMKDSGYFAADMLPERTAFSYIRNPDSSLRTNVFAVPAVGAPDGGAYTTAPDMLNFWRALFGNRLLPAKAVQFMFQPKITTNLHEPFGHYGYGIWIDIREGVTRKAFVEGYDPGVAFRSAIYPERNIILTMIGNTSEALWLLYRTIENELKF